MSRAYWLEDFLFYSLKSTLKEFVFSALDSYVFAGGFWQ
jgi:hypothetical protein